MKNIVVIGASYVGNNAAKELAKVAEKLNGLQKSGEPKWRVLMLDKKSHFQHLFAFPRFAILPSHEHKAFIPYDKFLSAPNSFIRAGVVSIEKDFIELERTVSLASPEGDLQQVARLPYEFLVVATGSRLSPPGNMPGEDKAVGVGYLRRHQAQVAKADRIVLIGAGAIGVQMATDIKILFPTKTVTLVHSRDQLMPRFDAKLSEIVKTRFEQLGIQTVLGSRAIIPAEGLQGATVVETKDGRKIEADLVIETTGMTPNSDLLRSLSPEAITESGYISVEPTLQVLGQQKVFAVGDIADTLATKSARVGSKQAQIVASNVESLVLGNGLHEFEAEPGAIHLTLGIKESIVFRNPGKGGQASFFWKDDGVENMGVQTVWARLAPGIEDYWA